MAKSKSRTLSKEAEDQVITGVKRAADAVSDRGLSPDSALEKVARDYGWGPELVRFAAHAYNTGRQNAQMESGTDALSKFADFPLADPDKINSRIWPAQAKTASDRELPVSAEYSRPPSFRTKQAADARLSQLRLRVKTAAAASACKACGKSPCGCKTANYHDLSWQHQQMKLAVDNARRASASAYDRLALSMDLASGYFTKFAAQRLPFAEVELAVSTYHGDTGQKLMDWLYDRGNLKEARVSDQGVKFAGSPYDPAAEPYSAINRCLALAAEVQEKRAAEEAAHVAIERFVRSELLPVVALGTKTASWDMLNGEQVKTDYDASKLNLYLPRRQKRASARPFAPARTASQPATACWSLLSGLEKAADGPLGMVIPAGVGAATKKMLDDAMTSQADRLVDKAWAELEDPAHDAELRKIRTQAMMADLMNDPVIGGYDPEQVSSAYNELSQLAPRSAQQPALMRSALRRQLQGNVQTHEIGNDLQMENSLKDTSLAQPGPEIGKAPDVSKPKL